MMNKSAKELGDDAPDHHALLDVQIVRYLESFSKLVKKGRTILDVGCGDGKPADEYLVRAGFAVNGIDPSPQKVELAKKNVPEGFFEVKDVSDLRQAEYCVDGVVSLYAVFQSPRESYQGILRTIASFMPNGGAILLRMGSGHWQRSAEAGDDSKSLCRDFGAEENTEIIERARFKIHVNEIAGSENQKYQIVIAVLG